MALLLEDFENRKWKCLASLFSCQPISRRENAGTACVEVLPRGREMRWAIGVREGDGESGDVYMHNILGKGRRNLVRRVVCCFLLLSFNSDTTGTRTRSLSED